MEGLSATGCRVNLTGTDTSISSYKKVKIGVFLCDLRRSNSNVDRKLLDIVLINLHLV